MTRSVGKIDDICRKYSYKIYKSHGATYMLYEVHIHTVYHTGAYSTISFVFLFSTSIVNRHLETALGIRCLGGIDLLGLVGGDVEVRHLGYTI